MVGVYILKKSTRLIWTTKNLKLRILIQEKQNGNYGSFGYHKYLTNTYYTISRVMYLKYDGYANLQFSTNW